MSSNNTNNLDAYYKNIKKARQLEVAVGLPKGLSGAYPNGQTVVDVGARHEYGKGVPRRSFLRASFFKKKSEIDDFIASQYKKVAENGTDAEKALKIIGVYSVNIVLEGFRTRGFGAWAENSQETIEKKGSSAPLIDSAILRNSITSVVRKRTGNGR